MKYFIVSLLPSHCCEWTAEADSSSGPCFWTILGETITDTKENVRKIDVLVDQQRWLCKHARTLNERLGKECVR